MKFSDISKPSKDLLSDDYTSSFTLKSKSSAGPIGVTIETDRAPSTGSLSSKVGLKFAYAGLNFDKLQAKADGSNVLETSLVPCTGCKLTFKANKGADLGVEYTAGKMTTTGSLDVLNMSKFNTSTCIGVSPGINVGGDLTYNISGDKAGLASYNVGASYATGPLFASATSSAKFSQFNVGVLYKVNPDLSLASSTTHSSAKKCDILAFGGSYSGLGSLGTVKAKVGSNGVTSACVIKEIYPKVNLTASGAISGTDLSTFKYGFGVSM
jgi:voltage-dependent anion channel protein 2